MLGVKFLKYKDIKKTLKPPFKLMGLDVGTKFVGIAISNNNNTQAIPFETLMRKSNDFHTRFLSNFFLYQIHAVVVGVPVDEEFYTNRIINFVQETWKINGLYKIPVILQDEWGTTAEVLEEVAPVKHREFVKTLKNKEKAVIDKMAAAIILQTGLDKINKKK